MDLKAVPYIRVRSILLTLLVLSAISASSHAADLNQQTLVAWENYIANAKARMQKRLVGRLPFLWITEDPMRRGRLDSGEIVVSPLTNSHPLAVPHGLIHHWIGAIFIPGATIRDLSAVVSEYNRYTEIYRPTLVKAEVLNSAGDELKLSILWIQRVLLMTAAFYTELQFSCLSLNSQQGYMTFSTTRVQQIEHYGEKNQETLLPDEGGGYLWRLVSFARFEERDRGLYLEIEVIALSKDLPVSFRFLLKPVIDHMPRQALAVKLEQTRQAIRSRASQRASAVVLTPRKR